MQLHVDADDLVPGLHKEPGCDGGVNSTAHRSYDSQGTISTGPASNRDRPAAMTNTTRLALVASLAVAAIGIALARGRKGDEPPVAPTETSSQPAVVAPVAYPGGATALRRLDAAEVVRLTR